jgi:hypothetical protein
MKVVYPDRRTVLGFANFRSFTNLVSMFISEVVRMRHVLCLILCLFPLNVFAEKVLKVVALEVSGQSEDFMNLENAANPFGRIASLGPYDLRSEPPARAERSFCEGRYDILFPVVRSIGCEASLLHVFDIAARFYSSSEASEVKMIAVRRGFPYDLGEFKSFFPNLERLEYVLEDEQIVQMLIKRRVQAGLLERRSAESLFVQYGQDIDLYTAKTFQRVPVYIAVQPNQKSLIAKLTEAYPSNIAVSN